MVSIEVLEADKSHIRLLLKGVERSYANALRRFAISEVPTMAIDEVVILENSSVMYDELVAHRLGLVPLSTDLDRYVLPEECDCKSPLGCSRCRVLLVLDAEAQERVKTVYSGDLASEDPAVRPISDRIPLLKLGPQQRVKLEAYAKLGKGREHAKWQPASASVLTEKDGRDGGYLLYIESVGSLPAPTIVLKAAEILRKKLSEFTEKSKGLAQ